MTLPIFQGDCLTIMRGMESASVDLVIGSPPYAGKGQRYIRGRKTWEPQDWVNFMLDCTREATRLSRGYVFWVVNGFVRGGHYHAACEGLVWEAYQQGIICERPVIWHKNAPPSRKDYFSNDWEYVLAFKHAAKTPTFNWEAIAEAPKYSAGGRFRQRTANGTRRLGSEYPQSKLARPRDVIRVTVGGGHLGSKLAHENEAPYPEKLVEPFVLAFTNRNGTVLDPFCGSGTTLAVAEKHGRKWIGIDARQSQVELSARRVMEAVDHA